LQQRAQQAAQRLKRDIEGDEEGGEEGDEEGDEGAEEEGEEGDEEGAEEVQADVDEELANEFELEDMRAQHCDQYYDTETRLGLRDEDGNWQLDSQDPLLVETADELREIWKVWPGFLEDMEDGIASGEDREDENMEDEMASVEDWEDGDEDGAEEVDGSNDVVFNIDLGQQPDAPADAGNGEAGNAEGGEVVDNEPADEDADEAVAEAVPGTGKRRMQSGDSPNSGRKRTKRSLRS
jgi:hypothetical protein